MPRKLLLFLVLALSSAIFLVTIARAEDDHVYTFSPELVKERDGIIVLIKPPGISITAIVNETKGFGHILRIASNETAYEIPQYMTPPYSLVELYPNGTIYALTISFRTYSTASVHYGAITINRNNYPGREYVRLSDIYYFARFSSVSGLPPGDYTLRFQFVIQKSSSSSGPFEGIVIPPFINMIAFLVIAAGAIYAESFLLVVSFFKTRTGGLSNYWKVGILASVLISAYLLYWAYSHLVVGSA